MFRRNIQIRRISGGYVDNDGYVVPGTAEDLTISASVQPLNKDDKTQSETFLPEGSSIASEVKIYTSFKLRSARQATNTQPAVEADIVFWQDKVYKVVKVDAFQSNVISHYKAIAVEVEEYAVSAP